MAPSYGYATQIGIGTTSTVDHRLDFQSESLAVAEDFVDTNGLRGTRSHSVERVRAGIRHIGGSISLQPTALELSHLLPWILGTDASGTTFALAETCQARYVSVDRVAKVFTYDNCRVNRATFRASQGSPLSVDLDVIGVDEAIANAASFPSLSIDLTTGPYMFHDCVLNIAGTGYSAKEVTIVIDNGLDSDRFFNSQTLSTAFNAKDRHISVSTSLPYGDAAAVYGSGAAGVAVNATFTNGGVSCLFGMAALAFPADAPLVVAPNDGLVFWNYTGTTGGILTFTIVYDV